MKSLVVDECVVREAVTGKKPDGTDAWAEGEFMRRLLRSPDAVFVNETIAKKYRGAEGKINASSRPEDRDNLVYKGLAVLLKNGERTAYVEGTRTDWEGLKKCDKEFVGVARQSGSVLVTSDGPLRRIVNDMRSRGERIECLDADEALGPLEPLGREGAPSGGAG